jgi:diguanylate cyclase (GGDEF)-like protein/PAS domain S-box-containing protein
VWQLDLRVVLFAVLISVTAAFTALQAITSARECQGRWRAAWLVLAGSSLGAGIWAAHFLAVRAHTWSVPLAYDMSFVAASLLVAVVLATAGFALTLPEGRLQAAAGGAVIGAGVVLAHVFGIKAMEIPATLHRTPLLAVPLHALAVGLACFAMMAARELSHKASAWTALAFMTVAICGLPLAAIAAIAVVPNAAIAVSASAMTGATLTIIVACATALPMVAARLATLLSSQSARDAVLDLRRRHEDLQKREEELKLKNEHFETALESMPHGVSVIDPEGRLMVCNKRYAEIYGLPPELTRPGTPLSKVIEHRIANDIFAGTDPQAYLRERLAVGTLKATSKAYPLSGGRTVLVSRRPTADGGWIGIHEDITERKRLLETEREAKEILAAVFDAVPAAITCLAADGRVSFWSHGAEKLFGYTTEEAVGQPYKLVPPGGKAEFMALFARALSGEMLRDVHVRRRRKDGVEVDVSFSCAPMRDRDGNVRGVVYALDDLTERERLNARLTAQNELLKQSEERLKARNEQLDIALANMVQGLALFDAEERLVFANQRYAELYSSTPEEMTPGTTLKRIVELRVARGLYAGRSVEDVLANIRGCVAGTQPRDTISRPGNGRVLAASLRPTSDGGWIVTLHDIAEQEKLKHRLEAQNQQLDAAINNMLQGLAMFDAEQRLIVCNKAYADMYGLTPEQVKPGTTVREIFEHRLANGFYHVTDTERFVDSWANSFGKRSIRIQALADGRIIAVSRTQTPDGGRVVTHEDITEREMLREQLEQQHRLLKATEERIQAQNEQLDAALNNMVQGLAMFDADHRVMVANKRFAEIYGLAEGEVKPGMHMRDLVERRIAKGALAGKSVDEVMSAMLSRLNSKGECQYSTRLDDGRHIAVAAQPMANGCIVTTHQDITEQRESEAKIVHMAMHDSLTGLPNRVLFNERLQRALGNVKRGDIVAAHLLDLDHFKNVNDTLGHPAGDKLLKQVAERLRGQVREIDTIARMGGDEFAILQVGLAQPSDASALAHRVIEAVSAPYDIDGHQVVIGTSVGIAVGPSDGDTPECLLRNADLALYRSKGDGRGTLRFFEPEMDAQVRQRRAMEADLRKGLIAGEFELHYQPLINLERNEISGFEALMRWRHPDRGLIPPASFIPVAEEIGFIMALGDWAIREACSTAAKWPDELKVAVNLSPVQFGSPGLVQSVVGALAASGLAPGRLELEITESVLLQNCEATLATLYQLRELGVRIAMDDFGTGYSSLSYLQSFPFDRIKIDRSFIKDVADGAGSLNIVRAVAALAVGLGMETTAEGVETQEQRDTVKAEGCTEMQGYFFSKPLPAAEVAGLIAKHRRPEASTAEVA